MFSTPHSNIKACVQFLTLIVLCVTKKDWWLLDAECPINLNTEEKAAAVQYPEQGSVEEGLPQQGAMHLFYSQELVFLDDIQHTGSLLLTDVVLYHSHTLELK